MNGFQFLGGIVRWLFKRGKTELKDEMTGINNIIIGIIIWIVLFCIVLLILKLVG